MNMGPVQATDVTLTHVLPADLSYLSALPEQGSCSQQGGSVTCALGTMDVGQSLEVDYTLDASSEGTYGPAMLSVGGSQTDPVSSNNTEEFTIEVNPIAGLVLSPPEASYSSLLGEKVTYEVQTENTGPSTAHNVSLTMTLPEGVQVGSADSSCSVGTSVVCDLGTLEQDQVKSIQIVLNLQVEGDFVSTVEVEADEFDRNLENNRGQLTFAVVKRSALVFPHSLQVENPFPAHRFIGIAVFNPNETSTDVQFTAFDDVGQELGTVLLSEIEGWGAIPPKGQSSLLTGEILELEGVSSVLAQGTNGPLQLFFMLGDFNLSSLDGVAGPLVESKKLYFPVARANSGEDTVLFLSNGSLESESKARIQLFDHEGIQVDEILTTLDPQGSLAGAMSEMFDLEVIDGYVKVQADSDLKGFEVYSNGQGISAVAGMKARKSKRLIAPHYFATHGGNTELRLQNVGLNYADVAIRAFTDDGALVGETSIRLQQGERFVSQVTEFLPIEINGSDVATGYLIIDLEGGPVGVFPTDATVLGAVTFTAFEGETIAALPLVEAGSLESRFLHVAQSVNGFNMYTGLAILNAGEDPANISVAVYDQDGQIVEQKDLDSLPPGKRVVDVLNGSTFFQVDFNLVGGHIEVLSDSPVVIFALFGDYSGRFLSAIERQSE
jgi:uncharacterized repeat protein (TIGR01451 family)